MYIAQDLNNNKKNFKGHCTYYSLCKKKKKKNVATLDRSINQFYICTYKYEYNKTRALKIYFI